MNAITRSTHRTLARVLGSYAALGALALCGAAGAAGPTVFGESPMVKVRPSDAPHPDQGVGLSAAKNEFASFQVVVHGGDSGVTQVKASFSGLSGPGQIGGGDVRLYRETYLTTTTPSTPEVPTGAWPDGLQPDVDEIVNENRSAFPFDVPANESRVVWVDVHVPADAAPGPYTGAVSVTGDGGLNASIPVSLTVIDAALPSTSSLPTAFLIDSNGVCNAHVGAADCGGDYDKMFDLLGKYQQMALEHRITLTNIVPSTPQDGDFTNMDRWIGPYMDGSAPNRLQGAKMTTAQYQNPVDAASYAAFAQHFKAKGWFDRAFDYTADEPPYGSTFDGAASRAAVVKQGAPDMKTLVTTTIDDANTNNIAGSIDIITPVINWMDGTETPYIGDQRSKYDSFLQSGKKLWLYQSCMSHGCAYGTNAAGGVTPKWPSYMVDATAAQNRAMEWLTFAEKGDGELYYQTAMALTSAWTDQYQFAGNGDGTLFYPGTTNVIGGQTDVPVASIRLKLIRLGMQDYEWLKLVSDAGDPAFAQQIARALVPKASQVPDDGSAFERARLQLISRYLQLTGKPPAGGAPGAPPATPSSSPTDAVQSGGGAGKSGQALANGGDKGGGCATGGTELSLLAGMVGLVGMIRRRRR